MAQTRRQEGRGRQGRLLRHIVNFRFKNALNCLLKHNAHAGSLGGRKTKHSVAPEPAPRTCGQNAMTQDEQKRLAAEAALEALSPPLGPGWYWA